MNQSDAEAKRLEEETTVLAQRSSLFNKRATALEEEAIRLFQAAEAAFKQNKKKEGNKLLADGRQLHEEAASLHEEGSKLLGEAQQLLEESKKFKSPADASEPSANYIICSCQHCDQGIEFDAAKLTEENSIVTCPNCGLETKLFIPQTTGRPQAQPVKPATLLPTLPKPDPDPDIYLQIKDERRGPYARTQVLTMWNSGLITSDAVYWHEGMSDWLPISLLIKEVAALLPTLPSIPLSSKPLESAPIASGVNASNLMELAKAATDAKNHQEAYGYYTKVLEYFPRNSEAWLGKGEAAGWMSTAKEIKTSEMIAAFDNAINFAPEPDKPALRKLCADTILSVTTACYSVTRRHLEKFVRVDGTWSDYIGNSGLLISALMMAHSYDLKNKTIIENIIRICADNIRGISYSPDRLGLLKKSYSLPADYEASLRATIDEYTAKMYRLDQGFVKPQF